MYLRKRKPCLINFFLGHDRREVDAVVFDAFGLTEKEQLEVYKAVVKLVKAGLVKAKSM